jgi:hypothetical protein
MGSLCETWAVAVNQRTPIRSNIVPFPLECRPGISQNYHQDFPAITGIHSSTILPVVIAMLDPTQLPGMRPIGSYASPRQWLCPVTPQCGVRGCRAEFQHGSPITDHQPLHTSCGIHFV